MHMRALWAILAGMALLVPAVPSTPVRADDSDDAAQQAAEEIADARERANAAADALFQAESDLDQLELSQQALENDIAVLQTQIDALRATVEKVAINRFTRSGTDSLPLLTGFRTAGEQAQVAVLIDVVNETSAEDFDEFDALNAELEDKRAELDQAEVEAEAARDALDRRREEALAEIERLKQVEADRLENEAIKQALLAEEAERRRQEDASADALRAQAAAQDSVGSQSQLGANAPTDTSSGGDGDIDDSGPTNKSTGGTGGGLTGNTGAGGRPGGAAGDLAGPGWVCPVQGPVGFGDTWGAPRSGGRSHQGVDMIANARRAVWSPWSTASPVEGEHPRRQHRLARRRRRQQVLLRPPRQLGHARPGHGGHGHRLRRRHRQREVLDAAPALRDPSRRWAQR